MLVSALGLSRETRRLRGHTLRVPHPSGRTQRGLPRASPSGGPGTPGLLLGSPGEREEGSTYLIEPRVHQKTRTNVRPPLSLSPCLFFFALFFILIFLFFSCSLWLGQKSKTPIWAKVGLATVGHPNFGQTQSIKVGPMSVRICWPK